MCQYCHPTLLGLTIKVIHLGMWPYCVCFQLPMEFWFMDRIKNCLMWFAIVNCKDSHSKFQNLSWDAQKFKKFKWNLCFFSINKHIRISRLRWLLNLRWCFAMSVRNNKACHIYRSIRCRCLIMKSDHMPRSSGTRLALLLNQHWARVSGFWNP